MLKRLEATPSEKFSLLSGKLLSSHLVFQAGPSNIPLVIADRLDPTYSSAATLRCSLDQVH
jgi:hypothetical protein